MPVEGQIVVLRRFYALLLLRVKELRKREELKIAEMGFEPATR